MNLIRRVQYRISRTRTSATHRRAYILLYVGISLSTVLYVGSSLAKTFATSSMVFDQEQLVLTPSSFFGTWQMPSLAMTTDLTPTSSFSFFSEKNSAFVMFGASGREETFLVPTAIVEGGTSPQEPEPEIIPPAFSPTSSTSTPLLGVHEENDEEPAILFESEQEEKKVSSSTTEDIQETTKDILVPQDTEQSPTTTLPDTPTGDGSTETTTPGTVGLFRALKQRVFWLGRRMFPLDAVFAQVTSSSDSSEAILETIPDTPLDQEVGTTEANSSTDDTPPISSEDEDENIPTSAEEMPQLETPPQETPPLENIKTETEDNGSEDKEFVPESVSMLVTPTSTVSETSLSYTHEVVLGGFFLTDFSLNDATDTASVPVTDTRVFLSYAHESVPSTTLSIEYLFAGSWVQAVTFALDREDDNALRGGYASFPLPALSTFASVLDTQIRVRLDGFSGDEKWVYLDGVWIETRVDRPKDPDEPNDGIFLISEKKDFDVREDIDFSFLFQPALSEKKGLLHALKRRVSSLFSDKTDPSLVQAYVLDRVGKKVFDASPFVIFDASGTISVSLPDSFRERPPGEYHLVVKVHDDGAVYLEDQAFTLGVLAINTDRSVYQIGQEAFIQMAALDATGHTICDASLLLTITDPSGNKMFPPVNRSGLCGPNNVVDVPDYTSHYTVLVNGLYTMELKNADTGFVITSFFEVRDDVVVDVVREGPTRIFPPSSYPVVLTFTPLQDINGTIEEVVPTSFKLFDIFPEPNAIAPSSDGKTKRLLWQVSWQKGRTYTFRYRFDAPDISPYMFYLGPATAGPFTERREWQIASDSVQTRIASLFGNQTTNSTNMNDATAYAIQWATSTVDSNYFSHSPSPNGERLVVQKAGDYFISFTAPFLSSDTGVSILSEVYVNGTVVSGTLSGSSFISQTSGHNQSSNHLAVLLRNLSVNDYIEIKAKRGATAGTVTVDGWANLYAEYIGASKIVFSGTATRTVASNDLNGTTSSSLQWTQGRRDVGITHSNTSNSHQIMLENAGNYFVFVNIPVQTTSTNVNVSAFVELGGTTISGGQASQGYLSGTSGHTSSSIHWFGYVQTSAADQVVTISTKKEAGDGAVTIPENHPAHVFIQKVADKNLFVARGTDLVSGTNWNTSATSSIQWATQTKADTNIFTHSTTTNAHQVTLKNSGNYLVVYHGALTGITEGLNTHVRVSVNTIVQSGPQTLTHYIKGGTHAESSGTFSFLLENIVANDVLEVNVVQEGASGTLDDLTDAELIIRYLTPHNAANATPTLGTATLNSNVAITPVESTTTSTQTTVQVTDTDGYSDIEHVIARVYRSGVTNAETCTLNDNNCYETLCTLGSCSGNSCTATCSVDVQFHADPTDSGTPWSSEYWRAWVRAVDINDATSTAFSATDTVEMQSLLALSATPSITYGSSFTPGAVNDPLDKQAVVTSTGNVSLDATFYGTNMTYGAYSIPVTEQRYAFSSGTAYASGTSVTTSPGVSVDLNIPKTTTASSPAATTTWFGLQIPTPTMAGTYTGTISIIGSVNALPWP